MTVTRLNILHFQMESKDQLSEIQIITSVKQLLGQMSQVGY